MKSYKNCQSCGMPLKKDKMGGGTNIDGSKSILYCSYCFVHGRFQNIEIDTPKKMQAFVKGELKGMGFPGFLANLFILNIPKLKRWT
ncbi:MAG: zinc ribbon domain-containing protein [Bacteroidia bacterium]|nr:zinc ribbon domain-containing protein [Bacteroidia bacterium]|tara:strand:+ start:2006 stop:2266 length:261 start_codon:yes stop_codon:yes gene_type:complete